MRVQLAIGVALAIGALQAIACRARGSHSIAIPQPGITLALYQPASGPGFAMVDDRRWIELGPTGQLVFDKLEPGAELASLMIEPLAGDRALVIGACTRPTIEPIDADGIIDPIAPRTPSARILEEADDRAPSEDEDAPAGPPRSDAVPLVSCAATGPSGRYLVRLLYRTEGLVFRARHELVMTSEDRATVTSRFAIATPIWNSRASVTLFDGAPGGSRSPREIARGTITLDGGTAILARPPRELATRLRRVYAGPVPESDAEAEVEADSADDVNGFNTAVDVWVWAECDGAISAGELFVRLAIPGEPIREQYIAPRSRRDTSSTIRMPLWIDPALRGRRQRISNPGETKIIDRFVLAIANTGDAARELWIEEALRPFPKATVVATWPGGPPELVAKLLRGKLVVAPGAIERRSYTLEYTR